MEKQLSWDWASLYTYTATRASADGGLARAHLYARWDFPPGVSVVVEEWTAARRAKEPCFHPAFVEEADSLLVLDAAWISATNRASPAEGVPAPMSTAAESRPASERHVPEVLGACGALRSTQPTRYALLGWPGGHDPGRALMRKWNLPHPAGRSEPGLGLLRHWGIEAVRRRSPAIFRPRCWPEL